MIPIKGQITRKVSKNKNVTIYQPPKGRSDGLKKKETKVWLRDRHQRACSNMTGQVGKRIQRLNVRLVMYKQSLGFGSTYLMGPPCRMYWGPFSHKHGHSHNKREARDVVKKSMVSGEISP